MIRRMSTFLLTLLGLTAGSSYPCAVRREIAPCTCRLQEPKLTTIVVACEEMPSFSNIIDVLQNRFAPEQDISLKISYSQIGDMDGRSFKELGMAVSNLNLNFDDLSHLPASTFIGLQGVEYLSLADNRMFEVPKSVLRLMPKLKTLDLGRSRIANLLDDDFEEMPTLQHLLLPGNMLSRIESKSLPRTMRRIHLGRNSLRDLNNSLRALTDLEWLFINGNQLTSLEEQLPPEAPKLILLHAANNLLTKLPLELRNYPFLDSLFFSNNDIVSLNGVLQRSRRLKRLHLTHNNIHTLADDEFAETESMDDVQMGHNQLVGLNKAFLPMRKLRSLNLTHNHLKEFSFEDIRGLQNLRILVLSYNHIEQLTGRMENLVELETRVEELRLDHNSIAQLGGALMGVHGLQRLDLSYNRLNNIAPDDLIGLEDLRLLDVSHNLLTTLDETSKTFLPRLEELLASHNKLTSLHNDFHGLPVLCKADLSYNQIQTIGMDLVRNTRCKVRGVYGVLRVLLYDNPVVCSSEFNATSSYMEGNFTILQGDFSECNEVTTTALPTTTLPPATTTIITPTDDVTSPTPANEMTTILDLVTLMRLRPPEVLPLAYVPEPEEIQIQSTTSERSGSPDLDEASSSPPLLPEAAPPQIMINSPIVCKDEGENMTLVIPIENGVIKKDGVDRYLQKDETPGVGFLNKTGAISIEIVEIKPLPDPPAQQGQN